MTPKKITLLALSIALASAVLTQTAFYFKASAFSPPLEESPQLSQGNLTRKSNDKNIRFLPQTKQNRPNYPWDQHLTGTWPKITKEYFRCKGSALNPIQLKSDSSLSDCGGANKHSLPLNDDKEFIFPVLIEVLNYVQSASKKKVVITSGHRCPQHNSYVDDSPENQYSKHMIGAEVSFYLQGLEQRPEVVIDYIRDYYRQHTLFKMQKEFTEFLRYEKNDTNVATQPWYNKEIFIKLFNKDEGRNFDNRHPYPYISIQVRWDRDNNARVTYTWDRANRNYHRY